MSQCLNPDCRHLNPDSARFCQKCSSQLLVNDRYRAQRVIGQGRFGRTFLAIDEGQPSRPKCVIKQFTYNDPNSLADAIRLFDEEAKRLNDLGKHPQIPEQLGYARLEDHQYLVQEFIDGQNLARERVNTGPFTEVKLKSLLEDLLGALHFVHGKNVIHRDIKPENIIRRHSDGKAVLVDFSATKFATATILAKTNAIAGRPLYAAPEQTRGKALPASDLYSLGVTCLYLLTQVSPFNLKNIYDEWVWRDFLGKNAVSDEFARFLDKLIAVKPSQRYPSAAEARRDLNLIRSATSTSTARSVPQSPAAQIMPVPLATTPSRKSFVENAVRALGLEMLAIPTGRFLMGAALEEGELNYEYLPPWVDVSAFHMSKYPPHWVDVPAFFMSKYPITQSQYRLLGLGSPSHFIGETRPVERVSWSDAQQFCQILSQLSGKPYRLPSEAEWEYACRAGTTTPFHFGETITPELVNYNGNFPYGSASKGEFRQQTTDVGSFPPNAFGLYDMHGNVWEWCEDVWHDNYHGAPTDGRAWLSGGDSSVRVLRGGSWNSFALYCRSADREDFLADYLVTDIGFRVVVSLVPE